MIPPIYRAKKIDSEEKLTGCLVKAWHNREYDDDFNSETEESHILKWTIMQSMETQSEEFEECQFFGFGEIDLSKLEVSFDDGKYWYDIGMISDALRMED